MVQSGPRSVPAVCCFARSFFFCPLFLSTFPSSRADLEAFKRAPAALRFRVLLFCPLAFLAFWRLMADKRGCVCVSYIWRFWSHGV
ncbi:hypothetical protein BC567DRAFT_233225 [Phyllosticta citribraziliensis]